MKSHSQDGEVIIKKCKKGKCITYLDENDFIKETKALKKYYMRTYKELIFYTTKELRSSKQKNGDYVVELFTDELFKKVYGQFILKYYVKGKTIVIKGIEPREILIDLYRKLLETYKGLPYRNEYELFKIKIILGEWNYEYGNMGR